VFAVVILSPPGAGKSSVLTALVDALSEDDIAHVAVEVETLVWTHPALTDEQRASTRRSWPWPCPPWQGSTSC
jgi:Ni2+-binding GTPase involved in maturation of urease and hydrogenase